MEILRKKWPRQPLPHEIDNAYEMPEGATYEQEADVTVKKEKTKLGNSFAFHFSFNAIAAIVNYFEEKGRNIPS